MKIISGGQTGIDRMGLDVAKQLNIQTGGTAPKNWKTENGPDPSLAEYGLVEHVLEGYNPRTLKNIADSDGTVVFGDPKSPGSLLTIRECTDTNKPIIVNPSVEELVNFLEENEISTLNVAGNRGSKLSPDRIKTYSFILREALLNWSLF